MSLVRTALIFSILITAGCGFQLRGTGLTDLDSLSVTSSPGFAATRRALDEQLQFYGVDTAKNPASAMELTIIDERSLRRPVSTTSAIDAAEYELRIEVDFSLRRGGDILQTGTVVADRIYAVDSLNLSGSHEEQTILLREMRTELAQQMLRRVEAVVQNAGG